MINHHELFAAGSMRHRVVEREDGSITLITDSPGVQVTVEDSVSDVTVQATDEAWEELRTDARLDRFDMASVVQKARDHDSKTKQAKDSQPIDTIKEGNEES